MVIALIHMIHFSALLLTYGFMGKLQKNGGLKPAEWAYYYIHRYWR